MKAKHIGLLLIASSGVVILVVAGLLLDFQRDNRSEQTRVQGASLVRLLSKIPYEELISADGKRSPLEVVKHTQRDSDFAYAVVTDVHGEVMLEVKLLGVSVPQVSFGQEPLSWLDERVLESPEGGPAIRDFSAPVLSNGAVVAHVRIGYSEPGYAIVFEHATFIAMLALPIFLLTPLSYRLLRREIRPLTLARERIGALLEGNSVTAVPADTAGEVGEFLCAFDQFVESAQQRLQAFQSQHTTMLASSRIVSYQKSRVESVLDTLPDAAIVLDETGTVLFANAKLEVVTGVARETALGHKPYEWCPDSELLAFLARFQGSTSRLRRSDAMEYSPEGSSQRRLAVVAHPLISKNDGPDITGTLILMRDITSETLARQAQTEFIGHMAHELKSPLNVLGTYSELLLEDAGDNAELRAEACNVIRDEVERLSILINTLLSISRIEGGVVALDRQRVRPDKFLKEILDGASRAENASSLEFHLELPNECSPIYIDKKLLRVAIDNLLSNAIKYNSEAGQVTLLAEESDEAMIIRVRDTGPGIPSEDQSRIYEKFFRSDTPHTREKSGHGLGLTLAKQIVTLHGGEIHFDRPEGGGSEFSVVLRKTPVLLREPSES